MTYGRTAGLPSGPARVRPCSALTRSGSSPAAELSTACQTVNIDRVSAGYFNSASNAGEVVTSTVGSVSADQGVQPPGSPDLSAREPQHPATRSTTPSPWPAPTTSQAQGRTSDEGRAWSCSLPW